jgi:IMP cyclohydrolase
VIHVSEPVGYLGIVRKDAILVREFALKNGEARFISTYELNAPCDTNVDTAFDAGCADCAAEYVVSGGAFAEFTNAVTSAAAVANDGKFDFAVKIV